MAQVGITGRHASSPPPSPTAAHAKPGAPLPPHHDADDSTATAPGSTSSTSDRPSHGSSSQASVEAAPVLDPDDFTDVLPEATEIMLNAIIDTVVVTNKVGKIVFFNAAAERMFGYSRVRAAALVVRRNTCVRPNSPLFLCTRLVSLLQDEVLRKNVSILMPEPFRRMHDGYMRRYLGVRSARDRTRGSDVALTAPPTTVMYAADATRRARRPSCWASHGSSAASVKTASRSP